MIIASQALSRWCRLPGHNPSALPDAPPKSARTDTRNPETLRIDCNLNPNYARKVSSQHQPGDLGAAPPSLNSQVFRLQLFIHSAAGSRLHFSPNNLLPCGIVGILVGKKKATAGCRYFVQLRPALFAPERVIQISTRHGTAALTVCNPKGLLRQFSRPGAYLVHTDHMRRRTFEGIIFRLATIFSVTVRALIPKGSIDRKAAPDGKATGQQSACIALSEVLPGGMASVLVVSKQDREFILSARRMLYTT